MLERLREVCAALRRRGAEFEAEFEDRLEPAARAMIQAQAALADAIDDIGTSAVGRGEELFAPVRGMEERPKPRNQFGRGPAGYQLRKLRYNLPMFRRARLRREIIRCGPMSKQHRIDLAAERRRATSLRRIIIIIKTRILPVSIDSIPPTHSTLAPCCPAAAIAPRPAGRRGILSECSECPDGSKGSRRPCLRLARRPAACQTPLGHTCPGSAAQRKGGGGGASSQLVLSESVRILAALRTLVSDSGRPTDDPFLASGPETRREGGVRLRRRPVTADFTASGATRAAAERAARGRALRRPAVSSPPSPRARLGTSCNASRLRGPNSEPPRLCRARVLPSLQAV